MRAKWRPEEWLIADISLHFPEYAAWFCEEVVCGQKDLMEVLDSCWNTTCNMPSLFSRGRGDGKEGLRVAWDGLCKYSFPLIPRCCSLRKMHGLIKKINTSLLGFTFLFSVRKGSSSWDCNLIMATTVCSKHRRKRFSTAIPQQKAYSAWNQMFLFSLSSLSIMDIPSFYTCDGDDGAYYSRSRAVRVTLNICCFSALYTVAVGTSAVTIAICSLQHSSLRGMMLLDRMILESHLF